MHKLIHTLANMQHIRFKNGQILLQQFNSFNKIILIKNKSQLFINLSIPISVVWSQLYNVCMYIHIVSIIEKHTGKNKMLTIY